MTTAVFRWWQQARLWRWAATAGMAVTSLGCNAGRALYASPGDYADYRRVRLSDSYDDRMAAAWEYLQRRPDGRYRERLKRYFDQAEPVYFRARQRNIAGLRAYLRAMPAGPHATEALRLLGVRQYEQRKQPADEMALRITQLRLDARKTSRRSAISLLNWWLVALTEPTVWQEPWSRLPQGALIRYRMSQPSPVCAPHQLPGPPQQGQRCLKPMVRRFVVRGEDGPVERTLRLNMEVLLDERYHPRSISFSGPALLLRAREAQDNRVLPRHAAERRRVAEAFSKALIDSLFAKQRICNGGSDASGVTVLDCEGVRLTVLPSFDGGDDRLTLTALDPSEVPSGDPSGEPAGEIDRAPAPAPANAPDADELYE